MPLSYSTHLHASRVPGIILPALFTRVGGAIEIIRVRPQSIMAGLFMILVLVAVAILIFWYLCSASVRSVPAPGLSLYAREELTAITLGKWVAFRA